MHKADTYDRYREHLHKRVDELNAAAFGSFVYKGRQALFDHCATMHDISPKEMYNNEVIGIETYQSYCVGYVEGYLAAKAEILTREEG